jgi:hypothetical protein
VFEDNWDAVLLFDALGTQWRTSEGIATGLDYSVIPTVCQLVGIPRAARAEVFEDVRVMEAEALRVMNFMREKAMERARQQRGKKHG